MKQIFEVTDTQTIHGILDRAEYGTLAVIAEGEPYAVPVNIIRVGEMLYFHGALSNKKMKAMAAEPRISLSVVESYAIIDSDFSSTEGLACPATQFFKSLSIEGVAETVTDRAEKAAALEALMQKLQPKGGYTPLSDAAYDKAIKATAIVRITPSSIRAKFKFGQHLGEERFEMIVGHLEKRGTVLDKETVALMHQMRG